MKETGLDFLILVAVLLAVLCIIPGEYNDGLGMGADAQASLLALESELELRQANESSLRSEMEKVNSGIRNDVGSAFNSSCSSIYTGCNGNTYIRSSGKITRMGQRSSKMKAAALQSQYELAQAKTREIEEELGEAELSADQYNRWYTEIYNGALYLKSGLKALPSRIQDSLVDWNASRDSGYQTVKPSRVLLKDERHALMESVTVVRDLKRSGEKLYQTKISLEQEVSLMSKREELLEAKLRLGHQTLGGSRYATASNELLLCQASRRAIEGELSEVLASLRTLQHEYNNARLAAEKQKRLVRSL